MHTSKLQSQRILDAPEDAWREGKKGPWKKMKVKLIYGEKRENSEEVSINLWLI